MVDLFTLIYKNMDNIAIPLFDKMWDNHEKVSVGVLSHKMFNKIEESAQFLDNLSLTRLLGGAVKRKL